MKCLVLCLLTALFASHNVYADDAVPTYKFSIGEPEQKPKADNKNNSGSDDEYSSVSTFYGYPRFEYGIGYNPSYIGFKQSRGSVQYNIAGYNYLTADAYATIQFRPENAVRLSAGFMQLKTDAVDFNGIALKASEANILKINVAFDHCFFFNTFYHRMCAGPQFGIDGFPVLDFTGSVEMRMTQLRDMMAGLHVDYYYPVNKNFVSKTSFSYDYGMTQGQNQTLYLTSDSKMSLASVVEWPNSDKTFWHFGVAVDSRSAKSNNNQSDGWKTEMLNYTIMAGYKWMTGPASGEY